MVCLSSGELGLVEEVAVAIIQPLVTHSPEVTVYDRPAIKQAESLMFARVAASNEPRPPRVAGEVQCKFCKAKSICIEYAAWAGPKLPVVPQDLFAVAMKAWTPEQRAKAAAALAPAGKILDEIKDFLKDGVAKDPDFVPGWGLTEGNKQEKIVDPQACFERFAAIGGKLEAFMGCVSVGKTKLKEAVNKVNGHVGKALDADVAKLGEGIVSVTRNAPSLARIKDNP